MYESRKVVLESRESFPGLGGLRQCHLLLRIYQLMIASSRRERCSSHLGIPMVRLKKLRILITLYSVGSILDSM